MLEDKIMSSGKNEILLVKNIPELLALMKIISLFHFNITRQRKILKAKLLIKTHNFLSIILDSYPSQLTCVKLIQWTESPIKVAKQC
jgi:hypothetical protein